MRRRERSERLRKRVRSAVSGVAVQLRVSDSTIHSSSTIHVHPHALRRPIDVLLPPL